jgi:hypothetical protein
VTPAAIARRDFQRLMDTHESAEAATIPEISNCTTTPKAPMIRFSAILAMLLLFPSTAVLAATWCNLFDQIMLELQEPKAADVAKSNSPKVEIPNSAYCSIITSVALDDREYYCKISQPTEQLDLLWGRYVWSYFQFCASKNLLAIAGRIESETSQPLLVYRAGGQLYTESSSMRMMLSSL